MTEQIREFEIKGVSAKNVAEGLRLLEGWERGSTLDMGSYTARSGSIYYVYDEETTDRMAGTKNAYPRTIRVEQIEFDGHTFSVNFDPLKAPMTRVTTQEQLIKAIAKRSTIFRIKRALGR